MPIDILDIIKKRRSIKDYSSKKVPDNILSRVLEGARWAPSSHNAQPWHFIVIQDFTIKKRLSQEMASRWDKDMNRNGITKEQREKITESSVEAFGNSPIVIVACLSMGDMDEYSDQQRKKAEYIMGVQSVAAAIQNMLLVAHNEGLGACWFCAPLFCQDVVRTVLKIPQHVDPQALITLGYPNANLDPPPRKSLEEIVDQECWRRTR